MIGDGGGSGGVGAGIVGGQVAGGAEVVTERPDDIPGAAGRGDLLVCQQLIDGRSPQIPMGNIAGCCAVEFQGDLRAAIDEESLGDAAADRDTGLSL